MIPEYSKDLVLTSDDIKVTLCTRRFFDDTGITPVIVNYALVEAFGEVFTIDAILTEEQDEIDWFDIFDEDGNCVNEGNPIYPDNIDYPDKGLHPSIIKGYLAN